MRATFVNSGRLLLPSAPPAAGRSGQTTPAAGVWDPSEKLNNNGLQVLQQLVESGVPAPQAAHLVQLMILQTLPTS